MSMSHIIRLFNELPDVRKRKKINRNLLIKVFKEVDKIKKIPFKKNIMRVYIGVIILIEIMF